VGKSFPAPTLGHAAQAFVVAQASGEQPCQPEWRSTRTAETSASDPAIKTALHDEADGRIELFGSRALGRCITGGS
jgi:hypothetical protein